MGLSLWNLFKAGLLVLNSIMILNRQRFLSKYGLDTHVPPVAHDGTGELPLQAQLVGLLHAVQYLKVPVIAANAITIVFELIFGS